MLYDIYENNEINNARFALGRAGTKPLYVFGINPSVADNYNTDRTMRKVERFVAQEGFDSFVMLNVYPHRESDPKKLPSDSDPDLCKCNVEKIQQQLQGKDKPIIWAAWGNDIVTRSYLFDCLVEICEAIEPCHAEWRHCGYLTKPGHPRHPSRLGYDASFQRFDIAPYLRRDGRGKAIPVPPLLGARGLFPDTLNQ